MSEEMQFGMMLYAIVGIIWVRLEHNTFQFDFTGMDTVNSMFTVTQQIIHYFRVMAVWPLYVAEDLLIYLDNRRFRESEEAEVDPFEEKEDKGPTFKGTDEDKDDDE